MWTLDQIEALLDYEARQRVKKKRQGGDSADKGAAYEREYALKRIVELAVECVFSGDDGLGIRLKAQACCFIDDFLVRYPGHSIFSQLKDVQSQTWTGLEDDCRSQRKLNKAAEVPGSIEIVVSRAEVAAGLLKNRPPELNDVDVIHFEMPSVVYDELVGVLLEPSDTSNAKRDCRRHILSAWEILGRDATLAQIVQHASDFSSGTLRTLEPPFPLAEEIRNILDQIPDFRYRVRARVFFYEYPDLRGHIPYECGTDRWNNLENRLKLSPPSDFLEFFALIRDAP